MRTPKRAARAAAFVPGADFPALTLNELRLVLADRAAQAAARSGPDGSPSCSACSAPASARAGWRAASSRLVPRRRIRAQARSPTAPPRRSARRHGPLRRNERGVRPTGDLGFRPNANEGGFPDGGEGEPEAHELLLIEEADAWFEYADATRGERGGRYAEIEPWAWARLQQRLRALAARRAPSRARDRSCLSALLPFSQGDAAVFTIHPRRAPARGEAARTYEGDLLCHFPGSEAARRRKRAARGRRTDCRT